MCLDLSGSAAQREATYRRADKNVALRSSPLSLSRGFSFDTFPAPIISRENAMARTAARCLTPSSCSRVAERGDGVEFRAVVR
jgi:hypothetical protein